jgi:3-hydroxybutyryl-CoA dehydrogenase
MTVVGVVGAGVIGSGVAQTLARSGYSVVLIDITVEIGEKALASIEREARMSPLLGGPRVDVPEVLAAITVDVSLDSLAEADFVIENITENWERKRELYAALDKACKPQAIFVVNTSVIPITKVAAATDRSAQVIGVHFMNPVPMKPVVELIPGYHTSAETIQDTHGLLTAMGKTPVQVRDSPGFVANRVQMLAVNEAAYLVHEGVASAADVDEVFRSCFGHPMGPLETADLIGVDTVLNSIETLHDNFADSKYRPCPLLRLMADAGLHGRKTGRGFYAYEVST